MTDLASIYSRHTSLEDVRNTIRREIEHQRDFLKLHDGTNVILPLEIKNHTEGLIHAYVNVLGWLADID